MKDKFRKKNPTHTSSSSSQRIAPHLFLFKLKAQGTWCVLLLNTSTKWDKACIFDQMLGDTSAQPYKEMRLNISIRVQVDIYFRTFGSSAWAENNDIYFLHFAACHSRDVVVVLVVSIWLTYLTSNLEAFKNRLLLTFRSYLIHLFL